MRLDVFRDRNFALYMAGNTVSWMGSWMQRTGIGWLSWELTHSPYWVGLIALAQYLPLVLTSPLFGVLLDRSNRKRYAVAVQIVMIILAMSLFVIYQRGALNIRVLFVACLLLGLANSAYQSARLTLIHDVVPREFLTQAISANSILFNSTRLVGPALGGVAIVTLGIGATFVLNAISYVASLTAITVIRFRTSHRISDGGGFIKQFTEGLEYTLSHERIRELMLLGICVSILVRGVIELLPAYAGGEFGQGSTGLATLMAASGAGAILAGILLSVTHDEKGLLERVRAACAWAGVTVVLFGVSGYYPLAIVMIVVVGAFATFASVGLQTILQLTISDDYRGRVVAFWGMTTVAGPAIGGALLGAAAQFAGLTRSTVFSGLLCVVLCVLLLRKSRQFAVGPADLSS